MTRDTYLAKLKARRTVISAAILPFFAKALSAFASPMTPDGIKELASITPSYPAGQTATDGEHIEIYNNAIYLLFKGSYSLTDRSFITVLRLEGDGRIREVMRLDIGIGADARAMALHEGHLHVFCKLGEQQSVLSYRIDSERIQLKHIFRRKSGGFVQTCRIINDRLYACNWGAGTVECYELENGVPSSPRDFKVGARRNASIVSWGDVHYLLVQADTNNLVQLEIRPNGSVLEKEIFTFDGLVLPRYGAISNGILTAGGYSTMHSKTVALDISRGSPVKVNEYSNMPTHVRVGKSLIGASSDKSTPENAAMYGKSIRVDTETGRVAVIEDRALLYPVIFREKVYAFRSGTVSNPQGVRANDSKLGESFAVFSTR